MAQEKDDLTTERKGESEETRKRRGRLNSIAGMLTGKKDEPESTLSSPTQGEVVDMLTMDSAEGEEDLPKAKAKKATASKRAKSAKGAKTAKSRAAKAKAEDAPAASSTPKPSQKRAAREAEVKAAEEAEDALVVVPAIELPEIEAEPEVLPVPLEEDEPETKEEAIKQARAKRAASKRASTKRKKAEETPADDDAIAEDVEAAIAEEAAEAAAARTIAKPKPRSTKAKTTKRAAKPKAKAEEEAVDVSPEQEAAKDGATVVAMTPAEVAESESPFFDESEMEEDARLAYESLERRQRARRRRRIWAILGVVAALALGAWYVMTNMMPAQEEPAPEISTGVVYRGEFIDMVSSNGSTEPMDSVVVTPEIDGIIAEVKVAEGSYVNAGDEVLVLKNDELDRTIEEAARQVQAAENAINQAVANRDAAYTAYTTAWNAANAAGDFSNFDQEGLQAAYSSALGEVEAAENAKATAESAYNAALAEGQKRSVKAPRSGSVIAVNAVVGGGVGAAAAGTTSAGPLVQIADLSQMKVTVQVNEIDVSNIRPGQRGTAKFSALPGVTTDVIVERIAQVSSSGEQQGMGVVTYAVDLLIPNPDANLKPGMTANVEIVTQDVMDTLIVPAAALTDVGNGQMYVTVVRGEDPASYSYEDVDVEVVAKNSTEAAVKGNLLSGDLVLLGMADPGMGGSEEPETYVVSVG